MSETTRLGRALATLPKCYCQATRETRSTFGVQMSITPSGGTFFMKPLAAALSTEKPARLERSYIGSAELFCPRIVLTAVYDSAC
jgi:hypothetical protein